MSIPAELITQFHLADDIAAFLKPLPVGQLRQLTRSYRRSHGLQESNGRTFYSKRTLIANLIAAEEDRRDRDLLTRSAGERIWHEGPTV